MKLAIDVQYEHNSSIVAGVLFPDWNSDTVHRTITKKIEGVAPYEPGSFYKRELPCILSLLEEIEETLDAIVIDGFVTLGADHSKGLGMHLYDAINQSTSVIGVAKKTFAGTPEECQIFRGTSQKALFVTAVGISLSEAKNLVVAMHGKNRNPTLLKKADQLCRGIIPN
ncbi:endonuclease V [Aliikangiella coralliicola]|uniref:Endonuclease V n=1 Tax=Aliikangiella coralliicola TaxID=2592383 RepID=A0A545UH58_9GAMM|nr:endonuclease V [Aliikangiella coralliicola]TQV88753.1 endonuclease V [Aliikangiella coralliicola]